MNEVTQLGVLKCACKFSCDSIDDNPLGLCYSKVRSSVPTFRRNVLPPSLALRNDLQVGAEVTACEPRRLSSGEYFRLPSR